MMIAQAQGREARQIRARRLVGERSGGHGWARALACGRVGERGGGLGRGGVLLMDGGGLLGPWGFCSESSQRRDLPGGARHRAVDGGGQAECIVVAATHLCLLLRLRRPPVMSRQRPRDGTQRMDAALDHFALMGYRRADVRSVVNRLLKERFTLRKG